MRGTRFDSYFHAVSRVQLQPAIPYFPAVSPAVRSFESTVGEQIISWHVRRIHLGVDVTHLKMSSIIPRCGVLGWSGVLIFKRETRKMRRSRDDDGQLVKPRGAFVNIAILIIFNEDDTSRPTDWIANLLFRDQTHYQTFPFYWRYFSHASSAIFEHRIPISSPKQTSPPAISYYTKP